MLYTITTNPFDIQKLLVQRYADCVCALAHKQLQVVVHLRGDQMMRHARFDSGPFRLIFTKDN